MAKNITSFVRETAILYKDLRGIKREWSKRFLEKIKELPGTEIKARAFSLAPEHNIVGIGLAEKKVDDMYTGIICLTFFVRSKQSNSHLLKKYRLPKTIDGLPVDVQAVGTFHSLAATKRAVRHMGATATAAPAFDVAMPDPRIEIRPAQPGCSIGFTEGSLARSGTFGALVQDSAGVYILSNNHVLACENEILRPVGAPVRQPSPEFKFNPGIIAGLSRFKHLDPINPNIVDCAIARVSNVSLVSNSILHIGPPLGKRGHFIGMEVHKFGARTDYTVGRIVSPETDTFQVNFHPGLYNFRNQILVEKIGTQEFAEEGDSGSLVLERLTQKAIGLLCARTRNNLTPVIMVNPIDEVLGALSVSLVL